MVWLNLAGGELFDRYGSTEEAMVAEDRSAGGVRDRT
jgi:hypothetical protein